MCQYQTLVMDGDKRLSGLLVGNLELDVERVFQPHPTRKLLPCRVLLLGLYQAFVAAENPTFGTPNQIFVQGIEGHLPFVRLASVGPFLVDRDHRAELRAGHHLKTLLAQRGVMAAMVTNLIQDCAAKQLFCADGLTSTEPVDL